MEDKKPLAILSRETIRLLDRITIEVLGIPGLILMENAGTEATRILCELLRSEEWKEPVLILAGQGNNGGDGFVISRHLFNMGVKVKVVFFGEEAKVKRHSDAGVNFWAAKATGVPVLQTGRITCQGAEKVSCEGLDIENEISKAGCIVDALFGTGLTRPLSSPYPELFRMIRRAEKPVFAVDVPSGLDAETGSVLGEVLPARVTATFVAAKRGFFSGEGASVAGRIMIVPISVPRELLDKALRDESGFSEWARKTLAEKSGEGPIQ